MQRVTPNTKQHHAHDGLRDRSTIPSFASVPLLHSQLQQRLAATLSKNSIHQSTSRKLVKMGHEGDTGEGELFPPIGEWLSFGTKPLVRRDGGHGARRLQPRRPAAAGCNA